MRILVLTDEIYPDQAAGVAKSTYNTCCALRQAGHEVTIVARSTADDAPTYSSTEGLKIHRFTGVQPSSMLYNLVYPFDVTANVLRWLAHHDIAPDVLLVNHPLHLLGVLIAGKKRTAPLAQFYIASMAAEVAVSAQSGKYGFAGRLIQPVTWMLGKLEGWSLRQADLLITASDYTRRDLLTRYGIKSSAVVPFGVDTDIYSPTSPELARRRLLLPPNRPIILTVRRLVGRMGLSNLIKAMVKVRDQHPDALLLIGGKGHLRPQLEDLVHELGLNQQVRFLGYVPEEQLPMLMSAADLFVLPTEMLEGFGMVTIEALACGLPVVGTPVGATPEILKAIEPQLLTEYSTPEALAKSISFWLAHPTQLSKLRPTCRQTALRRYQARISAKCLSDKLETLLETTRTQALGS